MDSTEKKKQNISTMIWVCVAIMAASIEPIVVKVGYGSALSPWQLLVTRSIIGALLILPLTRTWRWVGWSDFKQILLLSLLLFTTNTLTLLALTELSAVSLITIVTTTPAFVALINQKMGRDTLTTKFWVGFLFCFLGVVLGLDYGDAHYSPMGLLPAFGAVASSSIYRVRTETITRRVTPALISTYIFIINGLITAIFVWPFVGGLSQKAWMFGGWMGLTAAAANVAFLLVLSIVGSTRISVINMLQRPLIVVAAALVLHEPLSAGKLVGFVLAIIGIQMATVQRKPVAPESVEEPVPVAEATTCQPAQR